MKKPNPLSKVKTNSLARRMHDGLAKQINRKAFRSTMGAYKVSQENWDRIFGKKEDK